MMPAHSSHGLAVCARLACVLLTLGTGASASLAHGQSADEPAGEHADEQPSMTQIPVTESGAEVNPIVRALLVEAVASYEAAHYAEAQALFRRAHELAPSARTLRGLGMAAFELRQYGTALRALEDALVATERPLSDEQRAHVEELLARTRVFVTTIVIHVTPPEATLRVDGELEQRAADGRLVLNPGSHTFVFEHPDLQSRTIDLELEPGAEREISVTLEARPAPVSRRPPGPDAGLVGAGVTLGAIGLATLLAAATTGLIALTDSDSLAAQCSVYVCPGPARELRDRAQVLTVATDVLGTAAAAAGVTGLALLVAAELDSEPARPVAACSADGCVLSVGGVW